MLKVYVLDTNVLLQDPRSLFAFEDNDIVIPAVVIEEIDGKKHYQDEIGRNARAVSRLLDSLRLQGRLHDGVKLPGGGTLRVELNHKDPSCLSQVFGEQTNDNRILAVALNLQEEEQKKKNKSKARPVILVTKDAIVRIKADTLGVFAQDYLRDKVVPYDDLFGGYREVTVHPCYIDDFYVQRGLNIVGTPLEATSWYPNEFLVLKDEFGTNKSAIGRINPTIDRLEALIAIGDGIWGVSPRNAQQKMALDLLLDDKVQLVTFCGRAGTGKTLLALAVGLLKTEDEKKYKKLLVARPVVPMGKDIGYLPGVKDDKLRPWMQPIYDNLEFLFGSKNKPIDHILAGLGSIQVEALTYIRGRSIPNQFIIIDEAQNLSKHEVKTIISRVGENSKIVLMGDPEQIDTPYLDETNNGLTFVVERFKDQDIAGHVTLVKGERSRLAQLAADLL